jgi:hypothetical protein
MRQRLGRLLDSHKLRALKNFVHLSFSRDPYTYTLLHLFKFTDVRAGRRSAAGGTG